MTDKELRDWQSVVRVAEFGLANGKKSLMVDVDLIVAANNEMCCLETASIGRKASELTSDTIRVRIAVAVDGDGYAFTCAVCKGDTDEQAMTNTECDCDGTPIARAFIEADVPKIATVQGRVAEVGDVAGA